MDENKKRRPIAGMVIAVLILLLPVLYVGSIGPAVWLREHGAVSQNTILAVYAPITWLNDNSTTFRDALQSYLDLWVKRRPSLPP